MKWAKQLRKLFKYMLLMEKTKYLAPKYSDHLEVLSNFIKEHLVNNSVLIVIRALRLDRPTLPIYP